ncbi:unnamed protein product [Meganyctiphanes norvegica]|uniref:SET domain-containing protein n=1 Tax=Meganyctiphanes norvegica TaxID=48144 RepID=A0AAV2RTI2_MEGNR
MGDPKDNLAVLQKYLLSLSHHNPQWQPHMYNIAEDCEEDEENSNDIETSRYMDNIAEDCEDDEETSNATKTSHNTGTSCTGPSDPRPPIAIILTPSAGRQMVAARNIKTGEILLREPAFLPLVPPSRSDADLQPICVGCLANLPGEGYAQCGGCGAPLCTSECPQSGHSQDECRVLERLEMKTKEDPSEKLQAAKQCASLLTALRIIQEFEKKPQNQNLLWTMEANLKQRSKMNKGWQREQKILSGLRDNLQLNVDEDTVFRICGLFDTNSFEVPVSESQDGRCRAFFPAVAMMNHSCVPNTQEWFIDNFMIVRAAHDISKGSAVTLNYTKFLWGTRLRRDFLMHTKFFICGCLRCRDPTELGSHVSSLRCKKCSGMIVPPVGHSDKKSPWKCMGCKIALPGPAAQMVLTSAALRYSKVKSSNEESIKSTLTTIERAIGPQHFTAVDLRFKLIKLMSKRLSDLSVNELQSLVQMIRSFLGVIQLILPDMSIFRGTINLYYVQAVSQLLQRDDYSKTENKNAIDIENNENSMNHNENSISHEKRLGIRKFLVEEVLNNSSATVNVDDLDILDETDPQCEKYNTDEDLPKKMPSSSPPNESHIYKAGFDSYAGIKNITLQDLIELTQETRNILLYSKKYQKEINDILGILNNMVTKKSSSS